MVSGPGIHLHFLEAATVVGAGQKDTQQNRGWRETNIRRVPGDGADFGVSNNHGITWTYRPYLHPLLAGAKTPLPSVWHLLALAQMEERTHPSSPLVNAADDSLPHRTSMSKRCSPCEKTVLDCPLYHPQVQSETALIPTRESPCKEGAPLESAVLTIVPLEGVS